jgi:hypothetical protein
MTFDMKKIIEDKEARRRRRAALPLVEKLRILDQLRERSLEIAASRARRRPSTKPSTS